MRVLLLTSAVAALAASSGAGAVAASAAAASGRDGGSIANTAVITTVGTPDGFEQLSRPREIVVDVYFGGTKVGEARAMARPGFLRFLDPARVVAQLPDLADPAPVLQQLSDDLPANAAQVCSAGRTEDCGRLSPHVAGLIFDEDRFRADIFVAPALLKTKAADTRIYLPPPTAPLSVTSSIALALSGSSTTSTFYNLQNRTIVGLRNARIRSDSSVSTGLGLLVDDLVGEVDRNDLRFSGGLFWAPGIDLIGRRRMLGLGVATQFDTRADRESMTGTPIVLFLDRSARVDLLVDGRLVTSRGYDAGNNLIDTSALPEGSYPLVMRIQEIGGQVREERRFFVKNARIAPVGKPIYFAYAGMLANTRRNALVSISKDAFYQLGTARRLSKSAAVDVSVIGTQKKAIVEAGGWLVTIPARVRAAALVSTAGDRAALVQAQSTDLAGFSVSLDARRVWSKDGKPLLPLQTFVGGFDSVPVTTAQLGGSFVQASGNIGYSLGQAYLSISGSLRKDDGQRADYSVGPDLRWSLINRGSLRLLLQASAQRTRTTTASFVGLQLYSSVGRVAVSAAGGFDRRTDRGEGGRDQGRAVGGISGQYSYEGGDRTELSVSAGIDRSIDSTLGRVESTAYTRFGSARGDLRHSFEGSNDTQYGLNLQTGLAFGRKSLAVGGRDVGESALVVALDGTAPTPFEVLVNDQPRGHVDPGSRLPLFLQPYNAYKVRLRPITASAVSFDNEAREVTLYPGNVQLLRWAVARNTTIFAQALTAAGAPVAEAMVQSSQGVGQTDGNGYFQIEAKDGDVLAFTGSQSGSCKVTLGQVTGAASVRARDFASLGKLQCR